MMNPNTEIIFSIPGVRIGCLVYNGLVTSTLECFYSTACLNRVAQLISNLPETSWPKSLNRSSLSQFSPNISIHALLDKQLVEAWEKIINFEGYYNACDPTQCIYPYKQGVGFIYIVTMLLGFLGGLIVSLRIAAPLLIQFYRTVCDRIKMISNSKQQSFVELPEKSIIKSFC